MLERLRPTTPLGRAVIPVLGGILFFALLGLATWGIASVLSGNPEQVEQRLATPTFEVGRTTYLADLIADDGPLLFQGLVGDAADRSIVVDHQGDVPKKGWRVRYAFPADRTDACRVTQVRGTAEFTDCEGRTLGVDDLARPEGVKLIVGDVVTIDLRNVADGVTTTVATISP
ncbi:MAG: hypothetical protein WD023_04560 [Ilumatobacteraceae bacterium]